MRTTWIVSVFAGLIAYCGVYAMNGKAVAVVTKINPGWSLTSRLIVANVSDNAMTYDTILKSDAGKPMFFPTLSLDGTKVAFYRDGAGLQVMDVNGLTPPRTVANIGNWGGLNAESFMSWPGIDGGKWIYYHRPSSNCYGGGSGEIWRVNITDTTQKSMVCNYKGNPCNNVPNTVPTWIMPRWFLSADAAYSTKEGRPHTFPPIADANGRANTDLTAPDVCCNLISECNQGISASGKLIFHFSGQHTSLWGINWNHDTKTTAIRSPRAYFTMWGTDGLEGWIGNGPTNVPPMDGQLHYPRRSTNSDKIFTIVVVTTGAQQLDLGGNVAIVNWKDKQAVSVTNNPDQSNAIPRWVAEPGDFWLSGGPSNSYQEENGSWKCVDCTGVSRSGRSARFGAATFASDEKSRAVYTLRGARVGSLGSQRVAGTLLRHGMYIVDGKRTLIDHATSTR